MREGKKPHKDKNSAGRQDSGSEEEVERQTQEKAELVPPARRPPTAVGTGTPPLPPRPSRPPQSAPEPHRRPIVFNPLQDLRAAVETVLELADIAADAITKWLRREA